MSADLSDIYDRLGALGAMMQAVGEKIDANEKRNVAAIKKADESRANVHRRLDDAVMRLTHVENEVSGIKQRTDKMQEVTDDVRTLRTQAEGAGTLGRWLIRIGIGVVTVAGWLIGAYTYLTGRPPP